MTERWNGFPKNPEQDSTGHVMRVDGRLGVFSWISAKQWFEDEKGLWVAPADLFDDGDEYLGQLVPSVDAIETIKEALKDEINFDLGTRTSKLPESIVDQILDHPLVLSYIDAAVQTERDACEAAAGAVANDLRDGTVLGQTMRAGVYLAEAAIRARNLPLEERLAAKIEQGPQRRIDALTKLEQRGGHREFIQQQMDKMKQEKP